MLTANGHQWTKDDVLGTVRALAPWWGQLTDGRDATLVTEQRAGLVAALRAAAAANVDDRDDLDALSHAASRRLASGEWGDHEGDAAVLLDAALGALRSAGEALRAGGALPATATGTVVQLSSSDGGVPKLPVESVQVDLRGLVGDRQGTRKHHGRPWQALCIWSAEVVDSFAAQGHPIRYGAAGENITVRGIDWADVRAGVRLRMGDVLAEATVFSLPCNHNAAWFSDRDFNHMHHDRGPVSRIYAWVVEPGTIRTGDTVTLEP